MTREHQFRRAFTLVELLVVIGIIAVLISILLPALSRARRAAMSVQCMSNLRQVAIGFSLYAQENGNKVPEYATIGGAYTMWANFLTYKLGVTGTPDRNPEYVKPGVSRCPSNPFSPEDLMNNNTAATYATVRYDNNVVPFTIYLNGFVNPDIAAPYNTGQYWVWNLSKVQNPGGTVMLADSYSTYPSAIYGHMYGRCFPTGDEGKNGRIRVVHGAGDGRNATANCAFFDGHVETMGPKDMFKCAVPLRYFHDAQGQSFHLDTAGNVLPN